MKIFMNIIFFVSKYSKKLSLACVMIMFFGQISIAQPIESSSYGSMIKTAEEAAENFDYANAIEWFEKCYKESKDPNLLVSIGDLYMQLRDYPKAERNYERVLKRDKTEEFTDIKYDFARALKYQGKYKDALNAFNEYISITDNIELQDAAKSQLRGILDMDKYAENIEAALTLGSENINSPSGESSPAWYSDGTLFYSSLNAKSSTIIDGDQGEYESKVFSAARTPQGDYSKGAAMDESINRVKYHTGGVSFSADGKRMYLTRARPKANGLESSEIYLSNRTGESWGPPNPIVELNDQYKSRHPYEGELFGEKVLFFVSDRPGGFGGFDIYYAPIKGDTYGQVVNLGDVVNSKTDELSPFFNDGTLYFSSDGHPGLGGLDNFYSEWNGTAWKKPANMGFNYNSSYDDFFLRFNNSGNAGMVVSNRTHKEKKKFKSSETCCDDIYFINIRDIVIDLQAIVNNEKGPLEGATVELFEGGKSVSVDSKTNFVGNNFSFLLDADKTYKAFISKDGYYPDSVSFNTNGLFDDYTVKKTLTLRQKPITEEFDTYSINEPIRLNNIYYDLDKDNILPDAEKDLSYLRELMEQYPDMIIELSSHTDSQGESPYNQKLSQRRADSAKRWLVNDGITATRIKTVGYGETVLLNRCKNGVKCADDEHRLNRRTEFKIIAGPETIQVKKSRMKSELDNK
jgi:peptidoglycan-associated lipoprotein